MERMGIAIEAKGTVQANVDRKETLEDMCSRGFLQKRVKKRQ